MNCREVQPLAGNYLDGELPDELCDRIRRHLLRCPACREEYDGLRMTAELLRETHVAPAPGEAFVQEALGALARELALPEAGAETPGQLVLGIRD
jgi:anti-sigma factor RsiW